VVKLIRASKKAIAQNSKKKGIKYCLLEGVSMNNWREYIGEKLPFFETEIGGRIVRVSANLRPKEEGNIMWQLATKTKIGGHWSTP